MSVVSSAANGATTAAVRVAAAGQAHHSVPSLVAGLLIGLAILAPALIFVRWGKPKRTAAMWFAGADPQFIETTADRARITSMGCMVAFIALAACGSMTLAITLMFPGPWAWLWHLPIGLLWGLIVLTIDRWIISQVDHGPIGIDDPPETSAQRRRRQIPVVIGRVMLATLIGLTISEPIILRLFAPEIAAQMTVDHENEVHARTLAIEAGYRAQSQRSTDPVGLATANLAKAKDTLRGQQRQVSRLHSIYMCEFTATGSRCHKLLEQGLITGHAGNGMQTTQALNAWQAALTQLPPDRSAVRKGQTALKNAETKEQTTEQSAIAAMTQQVNASTGLLARERALTELTTTNASMLSARIVVWLTIMMIDLLPLLLKVLSPRSVYSRKERAAAIESTRQLEAVARQTADLEAELSTHIRREQNGFQMQNISADLAAESELAAYEREARLNARKRAIDQKYGRRPATPSDPDPAVPAGDGMAVGPDLVEPPDGMVIGGRWKVTDVLSNVSHSTKSPPYIARDLFGEYAFDVVVKILAPPPLQADVRDERRAMNEMLMPPGRIHDNLAEILDSDIDQRYGYYVVTQRFRTTLEDWLADPANAASLTLGWALGITRQILSGLDAAWERNFVHLDVKPANIALDDAGTVKLFDFGLLQNWQDAHGGHGTTDSPKFSHFYAPPEQMTRAPNWIGRAADVRAVAATLYRIVTGLPPMFREAQLVGLIDHRGWLVSDDLAALHFKQLVGEYDPLPLDAYIPQIPARVVNTVQQWLSRDPKQRTPGKARTFAKRLFTHLDAMTKSVQLAGLENLRVGTEAAAIGPAPEGLGPQWRFSRGSQHVDNRYQPTAPYQDAATDVPGQEPGRRLLARALPAGEPDAGSDPAPFRDVRTEIGERTGELIGDDPTLTEKSAADTWEER